MSDEELKGELTRLSDKTRDHSSPQLSYSDVRDDFCTVSMLMNERGVLPPRFRARCKGQKFVTGMAWSDDMKLQSNDRKIIDLHWLYSTGIRDKLEDAEFRDLLSGGDFNFENASRFVSKKWTSESRAQNILVLADGVQLQLAALSSSEVNKRWEEVSAKSVSILRKLKNAAFRKPRLTADVLHDFKLLWMAEELCSGQGLSRTGIIHGWLKGEAPLTASTISTKLKKMRRLLDVI